MIINFKNCLPFNINDSSYIQYSKVAKYDDMLEPLHNWIEHWITHKLIEKNKRLRLAAAKRTVARLEGESNENANKER